MQDAADTVISFYFVIFKLLYVFIFLASKHTKEWELEFVFQFDLLSFKVNIIDNAYYEIGTPAVNTNRNLHA